MEMIIYKITNKINGKSYIGQTIRNIETRFIEHCAKIDTCVAISNAIRKYGRENFTIERIFEASSMKELNEKEEFYIKEYNSLKPNGYNIKSGAQGHIHSEETKIKMSVSASKRRASEETKAKMSVSSSGKIMSAETREKMSKAKKGENHPNFGKSLSIETKEKLSAVRRGKPKSEEHRRKISEAHLARRTRLENKSV